MQSVNPEPYLLSKGWALRESNTQYILDCPLCGKDSHFYINKDNGLWDCKVCGEAGNLYQLRHRLGDNQPIEIQSVKPPTPNSLPNITIAHNRLMHNEPAALDYLVCDRKLAMSVIERFQLGVREQYFSNKLEKECKALVIPYFRSGKLVYAKYRSLPPEEKDFSNSGGSIDYLYNHDAIRNGMEELVICEAEIDALSLLSLGYESVVAIPGVGTQKTLWVKSIDVAAPKKIFICLDSDEAGQKAAKVLAEKIGIDKCYNIVLPHKDVNECLVNGLTLEQFNVLKANARKFDVAGVQSLVEALAELTEELNNPKVFKPPIISPWESLNRLIGGVRWGNSVGIIANAGCGKTTLVLNWFDFIVEHLNHSALLVCLEMKISELVRKWVAYKTQTADHPDPALTKLTPQHVYAAQGFASHYNSELLFGYTRFHKSDEIFELMYNAKRRYGCRVIALDNLQILVKSVTDYVQETNILSKQLKQMAMELDIAMFNIIQPTKLENGKIVSIYDSRGSAAIPQDLDTSLALHRAFKASISTKDFANTGYLSTEDTFTPEMMILAEKTRSAPGGTCTLTLHGAMSLITECGIVPRAQLDIGTFCNIDNNLHSTASDSI